MYEDYDTQRAVSITSQMEMNRTRDHIRCSCEDSSLSRDQISKNLINLIVTNAALAMPDLLAVAWTCNCSHPVNTVVHEVNVGD